jgi:putrescine transport system permease protein
MRGARPIGGFTALNATALALALAFLYLPVTLLVVYSFNASRLVTVWGGFSTQWYAALAANIPLREAAWVTLRIGLLSATAATGLGTLAALVLARHGRFRGRTLFTGMVYAPMVMPEVITGLSLLLLFVALGLDRGFWTVTLAHTTLTLSFVAVVVQARLATLDRQLEEAAIDLGATPRTAFLTVTLPLLAPAIAAGFLLAFTLSLDDLVVASFTSGPGATTLPMRIYSQVRLGVTPEINAASTLMIALVAGLLVAAALVGKARSGLSGSPRRKRLPNAG